MFHLMKMKLMICENIADLVDCGNISVIVEVNKHLSTCVIEKVFRCS